ncbi:hypothetical protein [Paenibacillus illinoisensis]|uniref:Uncharacterized protein n=1 Tax=Paenibacillus illinoisensis TaxID=59845 RepID=A0A2W0CJ10_9BACL|nr:hypothetical protein [Paenibacillus illinoisensis]PYY28305.1 hypothetical protein PIL02S_03456 [Paenibacillus illinoisensis]
MKKLPADVKKAIRESAKYYEKARAYNNDVRYWIEDNCGDEPIDYWLDQLIDGTEIAHNPKAVIKAFEDFLNGNFEVLE